MSIECDPVYQEFRHDAVNPPSGDIYIAAFSQAFSERLVQDPDFYEWYRERVNLKQRRMPFPSSHATGLTRTLIQMPLIEAHLDFPHGFEAASSWEEPIEHFYTDEKQRLDWEIFVLMTGVPERYAAAILSAQVKHPEALREGENYSVLDIGCSRNHGVAWLAARAVPEARTNLRPYTPKTYNATVDQGLQSLLDTWQPRLGDLYGMDLWPISDPLMERFQNACRGPAEFLDETIKKQYAFLERFRDEAPNVFFVGADVTESTPGLIEGASRSFNLPADQKFDLIVYSTVLYQLSLEKRKQAFENGRRRLKAGGAIVVNDFFSFESRDSVNHPIEQFTFPEHWRTVPFGYGTAMYSSDTDEFELLARWNNGRCEVLKPEGKLAHRLIAS